MPNNLFATTFPLISFFLSILCITISGSSICSNEYRSGRYQRRRNAKGFISVICFCICVYVLLCVIIYPFHVPCTIYKYQGLVITTLNYIAALLTLSSKDFISHLFTMHSDDMVICSLNVRDLSNNTKRRETFLWLKTKKKFNFLQEVNSTNETEPYWHSEWGYSTIFTTFSSSRAGVAMQCSTTIFNFQF